MRSNSLMLLVFLLIAVAVRFASFHFSVIDHDESTYAVISSEILKGQELYKDLWDIKPPGIFLIFSSIILLFGNSIFMIRLVTALVIGLSAFFIYRASKRSYQQEFTAEISGLLFIAVMSIHKFGLSANTEIFFCLFTALGLFIFIGQRTLRNSFLVGLSFGCGFIIKYFVLMDLAAIGLFLLMINSWNLRKVLPHYLLAFVGLIIPFGLCHIWFWYNGNLDIFLETTYITPGNYANTFDLLKAVNYFGNFNLIYLPLMLLFWFGLIQNLRNNGKQLGAFAAIWFSFSWIAILVTGKYFFHYYIQILVPLAFFTPIMISKLYSQIEVRKLWIRASFAAMFLVIIAIHTNNYWFKEDIPKITAEKISKFYKEGDLVYTEDEQVIYFLLESPAPNRFLHPTFLTEPEHIAAFKVDPAKEIQSILDKKPKVFVSYRQPDSKFLQYTRDNCELVDSVSERYIYVCGKED